MDICLMDVNQERLGVLDANYDLLTRVGSPTSIHDQEDINVHNSDLFIAVTPNEAENMTACMIANQLGAKKTLARIDNYEYLQPKNKKFFEKMGLNHMIYPEVLAAQEIEHALKTNWMRSHLSLCDGALMLCVVKVRETADMVGRTFKSGYFAHGKYRIVAIKRGSETIIPSGEDQLLVGDQIYAVCTEDNMDFLREQAGKVKREIRNIMFYGGSRVAQKSAQLMGAEKNIKILERDRELCYQLSEKVRDALIVNVDGSDMDALREEGIQDVDAFVAVTESSEANIFACLAAKQFGVRKTIAEIENIDYIQIAEGLDIGAVLNKKMITASYIYQMLLDENVLNVHNLTTADAQIVEFRAQEGSRVVKDEIRNLNLPENVTIGAIVRAGEGLLVNGTTRILKDDKVVVFCKSQQIRKLDKFFHN